MSEEISSQTTRGASGAPLDPPQTDEMTSEERESLIERIRLRSQPLMPRPTGVNATPPSGTGIRGVLFDVYGTLIVSGSGEVGTATAMDRATAVYASLMSAEPPEAAIVTESAAAQVADALTEAITADHRHRRDQGSFYPEVRIDEIWARALEKVFGRQWEPAIRRRVAVEYECRINPAWPMPDMLATLNRLAAHGVVLGLVSNAQFFTPLVLEALAGRTTAGPPPDGLGFDERLCFWSYRTRQAKPGGELYQAAHATLADHGLPPEAVLYVGNDRLNDIWPAAKVGFRTALFAGDQRSFRLRPEDERLTHVQPDGVVTTLAQIAELIESAG